MQVTMVLNSLRPSSAGYERLCDQSLTFFLQILLLLSTIPVLTNRKNELHYAPPI
ncbi:hypothetical protein E2C01_074911 [Portunus trituberculatus]|uniref:Uncharacterized protein n=1 Tax=Portunus trituberculatus TaxID=210409 RepID=A0A5B7IDI6_PORTR|nr:hypothetical protein [Portunus trituberculatus]